VACVDPFEIIGRERVVARHLAVGDRRVEQPMPVVTGEQGSPRHGVSPRVCGGSQFTKTETLNRRVGQSPDRGGGRSLSVTHCVVLRANLEVSLSRRITKKRNDSTFVLSFPVHKL
jgi:hypothetical protein